MLYLQKQILMENVSQAANCDPGSLTSKHKADWLAQLTIRVWHYQRPHGPEDTLTVNRLDGWMDEN